MAEHKSLGESLVEKGLLSEADHQRAQDISKQTGEGLRKILIRQRLVEESSVVSFFEQQLGIARVDILNTVPDEELLNSVPEELARQYELVPLSRSGDTITVAMVDPLNVLAVDELRLRTGCAIDVTVGSEGEVMAAIEKFYGSGASIEEVVKSIDIEEAEEEAEPSEEQLQFAAKEAPVVKIVNLLIVRAVRDGASDIHMEPEEKNLRVRFRIDGVLHEASVLPKALQPAVLSRLKIMADMNIASKRVPQDGRFQIKVQGKRIDVRVSTLPTLYGENMVMRLLDVTSVALGMDQLGMGKECQKVFERLIRSPHGIVLVTGPTGSGKTTTLYATLNTINTVDKDIVTLEDPIEYQLKSVRQSQVNPKAGMTFASGLRSILRQDPDIIMVGEIRDVETAEIAVHSALTGHLVFSTLHTNDAPGALNRLIDMGVEPFLVNSSVLAVLAQRLVRTICAGCKKPVTPPAEILERLGIPAKDKFTFFKGSGCPSCRQTGYRGRIGIYELMEMTEKIGQLIFTRQPSQMIKRAAQESGMKTLFEDGMDKVRQGLTTIEEIVRVTQIELGRTGS